MRGEGEEKCVFVCSCWLVKSPPLFMFGNLRNRIKEEGKEREGGMMETDRGREFILPLWAESVT